MKKSFVSLSISNFKLKVVKSTSDGSHVTKAVTYDVPQGVISGGKVQKVPEFAGIIKSIWKKEHIREKTVGIIIPEFSTFMKTLSLPHVAFDELDEAVRWRAREFLPHEGSEMVMDWKLIGETQEQYEVLVVAIEVEDLSGFVGALDAAGLLPVLVETTSLCLERLAEKEKMTKLVMYRSRGTVVAVVISGKRVLATSVLADHEDTAIIGSLMQIMVRFNDPGIESIALCGNGLTQEFVNTLHAHAKVPIELLTVPVKNLSAASIQDYIIGLSQQQINPEEPASAYSVNLLPSSWVTHYKIQARDFQLWTLTLVWSVVLWLCFLASLAGYVFLSQASNVKSGANSSGESTLQTVTTKINSINTLTAKVDKLTQSFVYPQTPLNLVQSKVSPGITLNKYDVNVETGKVSVSGIAQTRDGLLSFKQSLENEPQFSAISLPLSSLLTGQNVPFDLNMLYKPQVASISGAIKK